MNNDDLLTDQPRIVRWEDPSPRKRARGKRNWEPVAAELRANPDRWALIWEDDGADAQAKRVQGLAASIRSGNIKAFMPRNSFEVAYRRSPEDTSILYARYVGEAS